MRWRGFTAGIPLAEVALAVLACAAGTLVYQRFFSSPEYLPVLVLACVAGGVTAVLGRRRPWVSLVPAIAGLALVMVYGVFGGAASTVLGGMRGSWNRLLTVTTPAEAWGELLAAPALVAWAAAFSSVMLVLWARNALAPVLPALAGFLFALFVVGNQAGGHPVATVAFLIAALALIAVRTHRGISGAVRTEHRSSRSLPAIAGVASMVAISALFGVVGGQASPLASGEHRFDPRDVLAPPVAGTDTITPLTQLKRQLTESPPRTLFTVRTDRDSSALIDRVRTAALDEFDGTTWTSNDTYRVAGSRLTADPELGHTRPVTARVDLKELPGPYLPVIGWPSRLGAPGEAHGWFGFNAGSGVAVTTRPTPQGLSYDVTGEVGQHDKALEGALTTPDYSPPLPPGAPEAVRATAKRFHGTPYERLTSLEAHLQGRTYRLDTPPGHSYAAIARLLVEGDTGSGYAEQNAAAFTVLARMWGYPARVAVGYRLRDHRDGAFQVTTADAHAWSEVHFTGYGWVVFDPSFPGGVGAPPPPPEAPRVVPPRPDPSTTAQAATQPNSAQPSEQADGEEFGWTVVLNGTWVLLPTAVVLVMFLGAAVVIVKARRRGRRRRAPGHAAQVLGAWHEQLDRLIERGISPPVSLTAREMADQVRGGVGDAASPVEATAALVTTAIYAPELLDQADADQAWNMVTRLEAEFYPERVSAARLRATFDPRPLWTGWSTARRRRLAGESLEVGRYR